MIGQLHRVIQEIEHEWANKRLLVVGDVMLDKYIWGEVGRISPEAPVPVVRATHQSRAAGRRGQRGDEPGAAGRAGDGDRLHRRR